MRFIANRKYYFIFSGTLFIASLLLWISLGLKSGIDFTGGSLLEISYSGDRPESQQVTDMLKSAGIESSSVQPTGDKGFIIRFKDVDEETHKKILDELQKNSSGATTEEKTAPIEVTVDKSGTATATGVDLSAIANKEASPTNTVKEERFTSIGPTVGKELRSQAFWLSVMIIIGIILYVAWAFRKVSYPVASWKYGIIAVIALIHDVIITVGAFVLLGHFYGIEVNAPFVAAILTILGYSVNDTIVVFDRIRENLRTYEGDFEEIVDKSINETYVRSFNTSFTALLALLAIFIFGGATLRDFVLALIIGITFGTYSSIFIASPLLVVLQKFSMKLKKAE